MWFIFDCYYITNLRSWRALQLFSCWKARIDPEHWRPLQLFFSIVVVQFCSVLFFFLPSKSPVLHPVIPFWWLCPLKDIILYKLAFFFPGKQLYNWTLEAVQAVSIENHICADVGFMLISCLVFTYMSCKILIIKFQFSTAVPDVDHMHIGSRTFPQGHPFALTCFVQPSGTHFLSQNNCLWFQITAALIQRPTLSLAPALSGCSKICF